MNTHTERMALFVKKLYHHKQQKPRILSLLVRAICLAARSVSNQSREAVRLTNHCSPSHHGPSPMAADILFRVEVVVRVVRVADILQVRHGVVAVNLLILAYDFLCCFGGRALW